MRDWANNWYFFLFFRLVGWLIYLFCFRLHDWFWLNYSLVVSLIDFLTDGMIDLFILTADWINQWLIVLQIVFFMTKWNSYLLTILQIRWLIVLDWWPVQTLWRPVHTNHSNQVNPLILSSLFINLIIILLNN